ncbi:MAG: hypothetical protein QME40_01625 [bacterium]|nr:hypothetical protein [bacterium]
MVEKKEEKEEMDKMFEDLSEEVPKKKEEKKGSFLNKKVLIWVGIPILLFIIGLGTTYFLIQGRKIGKEEDLEFAERPFKKEPLDLTKEEIEPKPEITLPELPEVLKEKKEEKEEVKKVEPKKVVKKEEKEEVKKVEPKKVVKKAVPKKRIKHVGFPRIPRNLDLFAYSREVESKEEPSSIRDLLTEAKIKVEKSGIDPAKEQLRKANIFALEKNIKEASRLAFEAIRITELEEK